MSGWIKLHRNITDWEWFDDKNALKLLIYLNAKVNYEDKKWKGIIIKSGSMAIGRKLFSERIKMSEQQLRTSIDKLIRSGEITKKTTNQYTVLTLVKWEQMQNETKNNNQRITNKQPADNQRITTTKESKEIKEVKNIKYRLAEFLNSLQPFLEIYDKELLNDFYLYWTEKKPKGRKMLFEMQKTFDVSRRLKRWSDNNFNKGFEKKEKKDAAKIILDKYGIS